MNNGFFRVVAALLVAVALQIALRGHASLFDVHPDVLLLAAVCAGMSLGPDKGAAVGFSVGLVADIFLATPLGLAALAYALAGFVAGYLADETTDAFWVAAATALGTSALGLMLFLVTGQLIGARGVPVSREIRVVLVVSIVNAVLAPFVMRAIARWRVRSARRSWA